MAPPLQHRPTTLPPRTPIPDRLRKHDNHNRYAAHGRITPCPRSGVKPQLPRVVSALRSEVLRTWRPRRTQIDVAVLRLLDDPDDLESWSLTRDVLDVVET